MTTRQELAIANVRDKLAPMMATLEPTLEQLCPPGLPPRKLLQTLYLSVAANRSLQRATLPSLVQAATSAAVLGVEVDGVTGQGYVIPFKASAQFLVGYKGMVTIAARSRRTLRGFIVREGDAFDFDEVAGWVKWKRALGQEDERQVIAAFATSQATGLPDLALVMSIDELLAVRNASQGWKAHKAKGTMTPWATHPDAMMRKCPQRMLSKDLPVISLHQAAALDTMHDLGRHAWIHKDGGIVVEGEREELDATDIVREARERDEVRRAQPSAGEVLSRDGSNPSRDGGRQPEVLDGELVDAEGDVEGAPPSDWVAYFDDSHATDCGTPERFLAVLDRARERANPDQLRELATRNGRTVEALIRHEGVDQDVVSRLIDAFDGVRQ